MTANGWIQILLYMVALLLVVKPLGLYMARVYEGRSCGLTGSSDRLNACSIASADRRRRRR